MSNINNNNKHSSKLNMLPIYMQTEDVLDELFNSDRKYVDIALLPKVITTGSYTDLKDKPRVVYDSNTGNLEIKF